MTEVGLGIGTQAENRGQTTKPVVTSNTIEKKGLLQKIRGYETCHGFTAGQHQYIHDTRITTPLDILLDGGEIFQISFKDHVGFEMVGQKVVYRETTEEKDGMFYGRHEKDTKTTQELIPEDKKFPPYKAITIVSLR